MDERAKIIARNKECLRLYASGPTRTAFLESNDLIERQAAEIVKWKQVARYEAATVKSANEEIERLREALTNISSPTQKTGLLWWQEVARDALRNGD